mgnify:FL=1
MLDFLKNKKESEKILIGVGISAFIILLGSLILKYISNQEEPFLGHTFYILIGTSLIAIGALGIILLLKYYSDFKRREKRKALKRRKHRITFLKKQNQK